MLATGSHGGPQTRRSCPPRRRCESLGELSQEAGPAGPGSGATSSPGFGETCGRALAAHHDVDKIAFTGSACSPAKRSVTAAAVEPEARLPGARRQVPGHRVCRRGPRRRRSGAAMPMFGNNRADLRRRAAAVRRAAYLRRIRRVRIADFANTLKDRRPARPGDRSRPARLAGST